MSMAIYCTQDHTPASNQAQKDTLVFLIRYNPPSNACATHSAWTALTFFA